MQSLYHHLPSIFCHHSYSYQHFKILDTKPNTQNMRTLNIYWIINFQAKVKTGGKVLQYISSKINCLPWWTEMDTHHFSTKPPRMILNELTLSEHATNWLKTTIINLHMTNLPNHTIIWGSRITIRWRYWNTVSGHRFWTLTGKINPFWQQ